MGLSVKIVTDFQSLTILQKSTIIDIFQGHKSSSDLFTCSVLLKTVIGSVITP